MRVSAAIGFGVLSLLSSARNLRAQESVQILTLDASTATEENVDTIGPGRYQLRARFLVPRFAYRLQWSVQIIPIDALDNRMSITALTVPRECKSLEEAIGAVDRVTEEKDIPEPLAVLRARRNAVPRPACGAIVDLADSLLGRSEKTDSAVIEIKSGQFLRVTLIRLEKGVGAKEYRWRFVAPRKGAWITSFGIAAIVLPNGDGDLPHVAKGDSSSFTLTPKKRGTGLTAAPFVTYSWLPRPTGVSPVVSGGLGLDRTTTPAVFLGAGLAVNSNLVVSFGATLTQVLALNGKYDSEEVVTTNLTDDQINEKNWRVRPFVGLSWRFATNPFKAADSEVKAPVEEKPQEKPEEDKSKDETAKP